MRVVPLLVLAALCLVSLADPVPVEVAYVKGSYYEVGLQVGTTFRSKIQKSISGKSFLFKWATSDPHAQHMNSSMFNATQLHFPNVVAELHGLADGAGLSFGEIFFLNSQTEFGHLYRHLHPASPKFSDRGCTDVCSFAVSNAANASFVWGHNEDAGEEDVGITYVVAAVIYDGGRVVENFTAYSYPGSVAGRAYGWNSHGVITALNAITGKTGNFAGPDAVPRAVLGRVLNGASTDVEDAIRILLSYNSVVSFSTNVAKMHHRPSVDWNVNYANVELDARGTRAVTRLRRLPVPADKELPRAYDHFYHTNNYVTLNTPQYTDTSSTHRMSRLAEMPVPATEGDVRNMLGDTKDAEWPLWRRSNPTDTDVETLSTAIFRFDLNEAWIYIDNPKTSQPFMKFRVI